ncbi:MAG: sialate O-acetylesterase [Rudanella sp.]|nr:sialate O-acetylesterase [Rudanella sp.]
MRLSLAFQRLLVVVVLFITIKSEAQLLITTPQSRVVYQRNLNNQAMVPVAGLAPAGTTRAEARLLPAIPGQGVATQWQSLTMLADNATFRGVVRATGGWYQLQVRAKAGFTVVAQATVNRVGVGEVFVVAGQSNALGVFEVSYDATDDRVSCIDSRQDDPAEQMLGLPYSHAGAKTNFAPANPPHVWTMLGDSLTRRLNVPVLFLGAAQGGSSSFQWARTAAGIGPGGLSPYRRLGVALRHYVARTGMRAVLWHQGESDNLESTSEQTYVTNIGAVIQKTRQQTGFARLPWVMARASYISNTTRPAVIQAQNDLIATMTDVWPGPMTDTCVGPTIRPDGLHFGGLEGLTSLTRMWNQALNNTFFQSEAPFQPDSSALLTTGYVLPLLHRPGDTISVPFVQEAPLLPGNTFRVQLASITNESILAESAPTTGKNPIPLILPTMLPTGTYRVRIRTSQPAFSSTWSEPFQVDVNTARVLSQTATSPFVVGGQPDLAIQRIGYQYDQPTHGFDALVWASVPVEVRLERLDGGPFAETNWLLAATTTNFPSFTTFRNYRPQAMGVGGVEMGRYRL